MSDCAADPTPQIEVRKASRAPDVFDAGTEHPQRQHVERYVPQPAMDEHVADYRPPLGRKLRWIQSDRAENIVGAEERDLKEEHTDIRRDQPLNRGGHSWMGRLIVRRVLHVHLLGMYLTATDNSAISLLLSRSLRTGQQMIFPPRPLPVE